MSVCQFLDVIKSSAFVIFGEFVVLEEGLQGIVGIAPDLPDTISTFFGEFVDESGHFFSSLVG